MEVYIDNYLSRNQNKLNLQFEAQLKNHKMNSAIKIIKSSLWIITILLTFYSCSANDKIEVIDLKSEYLENPLGIDAANPRLS